MEEEACPGKQAQAITGLNLEAARARGEATPTAIRIDTHPELPPLIITNSKVCRHPRKTIVSTKYEFIRTAQLYRDLHGGGQERDTAIACIQQIFPRAKITPKCVDQYPIRVVIEAHDAAGSTKGVVIWKGDQKSLFRKYASKRKAAQEEIVRRLEELRADGF
eukprot:CCRYP_016471-RA/>CCRYP_016471-RA protein AED:0.32 eAED:0.35 QI:0/0/0/1/0/0/3/0/162